MKKLHAAQLEANIKNMDCSEIEIPATNEPLASTGAFNSLSY